MALTQTYVDPSIAGASGSGTVGDPYGDLQHALDTMTRDSTNGDQINIKAGTAEVLAASLTLATYGTPTAGEPLVFRGYTSVANDGGMGEINCNGNTLLAVTTLDYLIFADLKMHTFGDNDGVVVDQQCTLFHCEVYKGGSSPSGKYLIRVGASSNVVGCYVHDIGDGAAIAIYSSATACFVANNYVVTGAIGGTGNEYAINLSNSGTIRNNIVVAADAGTFGINAGGASNVLANIVYNTAAGTKSGMTITGSDANIVMNNIVCGFSGTGGNGIYGAGDIGVVGYNAFSNNTTNLNMVDNKHVDLTANDVSLGADPFTDAANGDFSLTAAAQTALVSLGYASSYLGAHANTDPHVTIGVVQYGSGAATGGGNVNLLAGKVGR